MTFLFRKSSASVDIMGKTRSTLTMPFFSAFTGGARPAPTKVSVATVCAGKLEASRSKPNPSMAKVLHNHNLFGAILAKSKSLPAEDLRSLQILAGPAQGTLADIWESGREKKTKPRRRNAYLAQSLLRTGRKCSPTQLINRSALAFEVSGGPNSAAAPAPDAKEDDDVPLGLLKRSGSLTLPPLPARPLCRPASRSFSTLPAAPSPTLLSFGAPLSAVANTPATTPVSTPLASPQGLAPPPLTLPPRSHTSLSNHRFFRRPFTKRASVVPASPLLPAVKTGMSLTRADSGMVLSPLESSLSTLHLSLSPGGLVPLSLGGSPVDSKGFHDLVLGPFSANIETLD